MTKKENVNANEKKEEIITTNVPTKGLILKTFEETPTQL